MNGTRVVVDQITAPIDLTDRLRKYISGNGIDMPDAEVPPGTHLLRVELKDSLGRTSVSEVKLLVQRRGACAWRRATEDRP